MSWTTIELADYAPREFAKVLYWTTLAKLVEIGNEDSVAQEKAWKLTTSLVVANGLGMPADVHAAAVEGYKNTWATLRSEALDEVDTYNRRN